MLHDAFPDFYINPCEMVAEGDTVVCRWRGGGTHQGGPLHTTTGDLPASGRFFEIDGISQLTIRDGKVRGVKANEDTVGMLMQLGVIPVPTAPCPHATPRCVSSSATLAS